MSVTIIQSDFKTLRTAYLEIKSFMEKELIDEPLTLNTKLVNDLGCTGDDNSELLTKFAASYHLDMSGFDYSKHFLSEGELYGSDTVFLRILFFPITFLLWTVKTVSFGRINLTKKDKFPDLHREVLDLTFGDMVTWYLTGRYNLRAQVKFQTG